MPDEERRLLSARGDDAVLEIVKEEIEERWDEEGLCTTDKSRDTIHRCLTNGMFVPEETGHDDGRRTPLHILRR